MARPPSSRSRLAPALVVAFVILPFLELWVIIQVAGAIEIGPTILLLVLDSILGAWLLKREGSRAWRQFRTALAEARWPGDEVTQGALILVGGTLLLTPGFVTDVLGFAMLLPPTRRLLSRVVRRRFRGLAGGIVGEPPGRDRPTAAGRVLDVEVVDIQREEPDDPDGPGRPGA